MDTFLTKAFHWSNWHIDGYYIGQFDPIVVCVYSEIITDHL